MDAPSDLTVDERVAIVDLMTAAMFANRTLKLGENAAFNRFAPLIGWPLERLRERFAAVAKPTGKLMGDKARVGDAIPEKILAHIAERCAALTSERARTLAAEACDAIAGADGERSTEERAFLAALARALGR